MSVSTPLCPKCGGAMEFGYHLDSSHGMMFVGRWARGEPAKSWLSFLAEPFVIRVPKQNDVIPIAIMRCEACGFLESYARKEFRPK